MPARPLSSRCRVPRSETAEFREVQKILVRKLHAIYDFLSGKWATAFQARPDNVLQHLELVQHGALARCLPINGRSGADRHRFKLAVFAACFHPQTLSFLRIPRYHFPVKPSEKPSLKLPEITYPLSIDTIGMCIATGHEISMHCMTCRRYVRLNLVTIAKRHGMDYPSLAPSLEKVVVCGACQEAGRDGRRVEFRMSPPTVADGIVAWPRQEGRAG